ncbi:MAG TPA: alpha/beta hydrolase-fold protein [Nocardioides sp.]|jgi:esterase/lipase superfamily enzyme|nr:alpha/beta hydrolase-fold protein [Nocardioides sp.]
MDRHQVELEAPGLGGFGTVIRYGHWGRPVLVFPSESGRAWDYENNGMVGAVSHLINDGRVKLYCVDSFDGVSWSDRSLPVEERAYHHQLYQSWITVQVAAYVASDSHGSSDAIVTGCSMGGYHALQMALQRADLFPVAICQSGNYDPSSWHGWGERGDAAYFTNPTHYVPHLHGAHLDWLRSRLHVVLTVGEGAWETHPTGSLPSARQMAHLLDEKAISHELDVWGHDVSHDWPWWRKQIAHHLPRFC